MIRKILLLKPYAVAKTNGGEISMIERLQIFKSWGVEVKIVAALPSASKAAVHDFLESMKTPLKHDDTYEVDGLRVQLHFSENFHPLELSAQKPMEDFFLGQIQKEKPDLVWSHFTDFFSTTSALQWNSDRSWIVQTDDEYPRTDRWEDFQNVFEHYEKLKWQLVASQFMKKSVEASFPWSKAIYLPNPLSSIQIPEKISAGTRAREYLLFVNPIPVKGVEFMLKLASAMPDEKFLFVGNWVDERPTSLPKNVEFLPRQNGLQEVFRKSKALLMPSVWNEAFGRLPLEAMAAGVPVFSSDRGALPETVAEGGKVLALDIEKWKSAISHMTRNPMIDAGLTRVKRYRDETDAFYARLQTWFQSEESPLNPVLIN